MAFRLKPGARPEQALEILRALANALRNLPAEVGGGNSLGAIEGRRDGYLQWVENAEAQLANFADERDVAAQLHTRSFWEIRAISTVPPRSPRPIPLIDSEINMQKALLIRTAEDLRRREERAMAGGLIAVVDTHVLLHYEPPESIDWAGIVSAPQVRVLLPIRVVDELDEKKYTGSDRVRQKARAILPHIESIVGPDGAPGSAIREGVTIEIELVGMDQQHPDADRSIIETCIEQGQLSGDPARVTLVTGDAGMRIRAAQRGVRVIAIPERYLRNAD